MNASDVFSDEGIHRQRYSEVDLFSVDGRIGRVGYFFYSLILPFIFFWIIASLAGIVGQLGSVGKLFAYLLLAAAIGAALILLFQLTIQRCHDFNVSGWLSTLILIPFGILIFWLIPGSNSINRYGEPPEPTVIWETIGSFVLLTALIAGITYGLLYFGNHLSFSGLIDMFKFS